MENNFFTGFYGRPWTSDQRKDLFNKMRKLGLNSYLYAPKDDCKHRMFWRDTYSVEETENMRALISSAKEYNITFYYALSPGIDITYSSTKDITALKRKLEQVSQLGCNAFALLFDDIEPEMGETDKEIFQSFAHAQVSVSNEVFQHLGHPKFMFCPTEYCASRAVPNVLNSEYLNVVGSKLFPSIDIMWTGPKVISETITLQSIQELTQVFRRPPVIWDNIHANDYDHRRLFLGPYSGRSPDLIPLLKGVLTNPNCEYESNFIAFHTLAQWSKSSVDGKRNLSSVNDSVTADIKLETQSEDGSSVEDIPSQLHPDTYHPRQALKLAINDWIAEFDTPKDAYSKYLVPAKPLVFPTCGLVAPLGADSGVPLHNKNPVLPAVAPIALCLALTPTTQTISTSTLSMVYIYFRNYDLLLSVCVCGLA
ncbi:MGEA5 (predicted) [Pycnogonum litorale]